VIRSSNAEPLHPPVAHPPHDHVVDAGGPDDSAPAESGARPAIVQLARAFWSAALDATEEPLDEGSRDVYRRLRLPDSEARRLEALGAERWDHQNEGGHDFWVLRDPWGNEFCVLRPEFPELLARRDPWTAPDRR